MTVLINPFVFADGGGGGGVGTLGSPVRDVAVTSVNGASSPVTIDYPSSVSADDRLILWVGSDTSQTIGASGWTELDQTVNSDTGAFFWKIADGTEGGTTFEITLTTGNRDTSAIVWAVESTGTPEVSLATGTSATPDPPSLTPSGGADDYVWIIGIVIDLDIEYRDPPDGLGGWHMSDALGSARIYGMDRLLNASTLDPDALTAASSDTWVAGLVAIPVAPVTGFPVAEGVAATTWATADTSQTVDLPASISSGELLIAEVFSSNTATATMSGWTVLDSEVEGNTATTLLYRTADGSEGSTAALTFSTSASGGAIVRRITAADTSPTAAMSNASSQTVTPPTLAPAGGSDKILWITGAGCDDFSTVVPASFPPYSLSPGWARRPDGGGIYSGARNIETGSVTPPPWKLSTNRRHCAYTIAVYPAP